MSAPPAPRLRTLVVDSGALIRGERIAHLADDFVTVPEVLGEIRDASTRQKLAALPFELRTREPSSEAMQAVVDFAKKTGDFFSLSVPDLKVLALTYMLEKETHGVAHIRVEPLRQGGARAPVPAAERNRAAPPEPDEGAAKAEEATDSEPKSKPKRTRNRRKKKKDTRSADATSAAATASPPETHAAPAPAQPRTFASLFGSPPASAPGAASSKARSQDGSPNSEDGEDLGGGMWDDEDVQGVGAPVPDEDNVRARAGSGEEGGQDEEGAMLDWPSLPPPGTAEEPEDVPEDVATWTRPSQEDARAAAAEALARFRDMHMHERGPGSSDGAGQASESHILGSSNLAVAEEDIDSEGEGGMWASPVRIGGADQPRSILGWAEVPGSAPRKTGSSTQPAPFESSVACVTTDYAMQNVMLQMQLRAVGLEGRTITQVRHWVLKCDTCRHITQDLSKLFCPECGSATLAKLTYTVNAKGVLRYHYKKGRKVNTRGSKYPLPKSTGGRNGDLLLREDQLLVGAWAQRAKAKSNVTSMWGEHINDAVGLATTRVSGVQALPVGLPGNPQAAKGRERRGKKKKKSAARGPAGLAR